MNELIVDSEYLRQLTFYFSLIRRTHCIIVCVFQVQAEFRYSSWSMVLHAQMEKYLMFAEEPQLIDKIMPELLKLLKIIEKDPHTYCYKVVMCYDTYYSSSLYFQTCVGCQPLDCQPKAAC